MAQAYKNGLGFGKFIATCGKINISPFPPDEVPALGKGFVLIGFQFCAPTLRLNFEMVILGIDFDLTIYTGKDTNHTITDRSLKGIYYI